MINHTIKPIDCPYCGLALNHTQTCKLSYANTGRHWLTAAIAVDTTPQQMTPRDPDAASKGGIPPAPKP